MKQLLIIPVLLAACTTGPSMTPVTSKSGTPVWAVDPVVQRPAGANRIIEATDDDYAPVVVIDDTPTPPTPPAPLTPKQNPDSVDPVKPGDDTDCGCEGEPDDEGWYDKAINRLHEAEETTIDAREELEDLRDVDAPDGRVHEAEETLYDAEEEEDDIREAILSEI